ELLVRKEQFNRVSNLVGIPATAKYSSYSVLHQLGHPAYCRRDDRHAACRGLHKANRHSFIVTGQNPDGRSLPIAAHLLLVDGSRHFHYIVEPTTGPFSQQLRPKRSVPSENAAKLNPTIAQKRAHFHQEREAFHLNVPGHTENKRQSLFILRLLQRLKERRV